MRLDIAQLEFVHIVLRQMILWLEAETGLEFTGTSLYRIGDSGVHGQLPLRGIDLRMRNLAIGKAVEAEINAYWAYDRSRPHLNCALLHGEGSSLHLHLQVCDRTTVREQS